MIVATASVLLAAAASALLLWWYNKRKRTKLQARELLANMETSPNSTPYQEEPISSVFDSSRPNATTVIQNTVYRDSVNLDAILDPIPEEDGADCSRAQRAHRRRQKHGRRDKRTTNGSSSRNGYKRTRSDPESLDSDPADVLGGNSVDVSGPNSAGFSGPSQNEGGVDMLISTEDVLVTIATEPDARVDGQPRSNKLNGFPIV
jgi:hypothetical protein